MRLTYGPSTDVFDDPVWGYYHPNEQAPYIHVDESVVTKRMFLNVMAHEMVHQLQHELELPLTHGHFFKAQAKRLARYGLLI